MSVRQLVRVQLRRVLIGLVGAATNQEGVINRQTSQLGVGKSRGPARRVSLDDAYTRYLRLATTQSFPYNGEDTKYELWEELRGTWGGMYSRLVWRGQDPPNSTWMLASYALNQACSFHSSIRVRAGIILLALIGSDETLDPIKRWTPRGGE